MTDEENTGRPVSLLTQERRSSFVSALKFLKVDYSTTRGVRGLMKLLSTKPESTVIITVSDKSVERAALKHALLDCADLKTEKVFLLGSKSSVEDLYDQIQADYNNATAVVLRDSECDPGQMTLFELLCHVCDVGGNQVLQDKIIAAIDGQKSNIGALCEPDYFIPPLSELAYHNNPIGGSRYPAFCTLDSFENDAYLPKNELFLSLIEEMEEELGRATKMHLHRATFLTHKIFYRLGVHGEAVDLYLAAAMLHLYPEAVDNVSLSFLPITGSLNRQRRGYLVESINKNAVTLETQFGIQNLGSVLKSIATLLEFSSHTLRGDDLRNCSLIVLALLVDRECWWEGYFSGYGAYVIFRWLEEGKARIFDAQVVRLIVKFIVEAAESVNASKDLVDAQATPLSQLRPGMRIEKEVVSLEGEVLLEPGLMLDEAQVVSLWKLAMMKGVGPVRVSGG